MNVNVSTAVSDEVGSVCVEGEVDVSNADALREAVLGLIADDAVKTVEVDLAGVPYIDSTGIGVLVGAAHRAEDAGKALRVLRAQDNVSRIFGMLGVDEIIG